MLNSLNCYLAASFAVFPSMPALFLTPEKPDMRHETEDNDSERSVKSAFPK